MKFISFPHKGLEAFFTTYNCDSVKICVHFGQEEILKKSTQPQPKCIVIAGPNGSGKTTFAREFLSKELHVSHFINADLIASGLSPLKPELAAIAAGRIVLSEIDRLVRGRENFSFESTLSGRSHGARLAQVKTAGYRVEIVFLKIKSPQLALRRISARVRQGGHDIPREDVLRRFARSWANLSAIYRPLADEWWVYDNTASLILLEHEP